MQEMQGWKRRAAKRSAIILLTVAVAGLMVPSGPANHHLDEPAGDAPHVHDHWDGREKLSVIDRTVAVDHVDRTLEGVPWSKAPVYRIPVPLRRDAPPDVAHIVPEGTAKVTVRLSWTGDAIGRPTVCASSRGVPWDCPDAPSHRFSESGEVWTIDANTTDDRGNRLLDDDGIEAPHQARSDWGFAVWLCTGGGPDDPRCVHDPGIESFRIDVDVHRGVGDLPVWRAHPDPYEGTSRRVILPVGSVVSEPAAHVGYVGHTWKRLWGDRTPYAYRNAQILKARHGVEEPQIPWNTERVRVRLSWDAAVPVDLELGYSTAADRIDGPWRFAGPDGAPCGPDCVEYVIPTGEFINDSPYACRILGGAGSGYRACSSRWQWAVFPADLPPRPLVDAQVRLGIVAEGPT